MAVVSGRSGAYVDPVNNQNVTISGGVATVSGRGLKTLKSESGVTDTLDKIEGLTNEQEIEIMASSDDGGHTVTITAGAFLKLPSPTFIISGYRIVTLKCIGSDACVMQSSSANRS
jgi:hypothetical protein